MIDAALVNSGGLICGLSTVGRDRHVLDHKLRVDKRPAALKVRSEGIPGAIKALPNWALWSYRWNDSEDKWDKPPYQGASSTNPETWRTFDEAYERYVQLGLDGLYFALPNDRSMTGGDFDHCLLDGRARPDVERVLKMLGTYVEISPSSGGLRTLNFGTKPGGRSKIEIDGQTYEFWDHGRFLSITGHVYDSYPKTVNNNPDAVADVYRDRFGDDPAPKAAAVVRSTGPQMSDRAIIKKALAAADGDKFARLFYNGDTSDYGEDDSRADAALCSLLRFWVGDDPVRIDSLFRQSQLMRPLTR
jgi:primase-polymerase (primpol)-like protein